MSIILKSMIACAGWYFCGIPVSTVIVLIGGLLMGKDQLGNRELGFILILSIILTHWVFNHFQIFKRLEERVKKAHTEKEKQMRAEVEKNKVNWTCPNCGAPNRTLKNKCKCEYCDSKFFYEEIKKSIDKQSHLRYN